MKNFTIDEYRQIIRFYKKPMPQTIHRIRNKAKILLCNMLETNVTDNKKLMKMNRRGNKNINRTLKKKYNRSGMYDGCIRQK